jgi:hypothetical protein
MMLAATRIVADVMCRLMPTTVATPPGVTVSSRGQPFTYRVYM